MKFCIQQFETQIDCRNCSQNFVNKLINFMEHSKKLTFITRNNFQLLQLKMYQPYPYQQQVAQPSNVGARQVINASQPQADQQNIPVTQTYPNANAAGDLQNQKQTSQVSQDGKLLNGQSGPDLARQAPVTGQQQVANQAVNMGQIIPEQSQQHPFNQYGMKQLITPNGMQVPPNQGYPHHLGPTTAFHPSMMSMHYAPAPPYIMMGHMPMHPSHLNPHQLNPHQLPPGLQQHSQAPPGLMVPSQGDQNQSTTTTQLQQKQGEAGVASGKVGGEGDVTAQSALGVTGQQSVQNEQQKRQHEDGQQVVANVPRGSLEVATGQAPTQAQISTQLAPSQQQQPPSGQKLQNDPSNNAKNATNASQVTANQIQVPNMMIPGGPQGMNAQQQQQFAYQALQNYYNQMAAASYMGQLGSMNPIGGPAMPGMNGVPAVPGLPGMQHNSMNSQQYSQMAAAAQNTAAYGGFYPMPHQGVGGNQGGPYNQLAAHHYMAHHNPYTLYPSALPNSNYDYQKFMANAKVKQGQGADQVQNKTNTTTNAIPVPQHQIGTFDQISFQPLMENNQLVATTNNPAGMPYHYIQSDPTKLIANQMPGMGMAPNMPRQDYGQLQKQSQNSNGTNNKGARQQQMGPNGVNGANLPGGGQVQVGEVGAEKKGGEIPDKNQQIVAQAGPQAGTQQQIQQKQKEQQQSKKDSEIVRPLSCKIKGKAQFECKKHIITVDERYTVQKLVGSGAYGHVFAAKDAKTGKKVAIKRINKAFEDVIDAKRVLREIKILKFFDHENIIELVDIQRPPSRTGYDDVYIITQLMEADLHQLIYSRQQLEADHYQYFMYQIMRGIYYMHTANIMHRDLKPSNILINAECDLKICDFGLSRGFGEVEDVLKKTAYVVTRWYRAPEVSLLNKSYNQSLDMWSAGCIFAELMQRAVLFPADNNANEVIMILQLLGVPDDEDLKIIDNPQALVFIKRQRALQLEQGKEPIDWKKRIPHASDQAIDLLKGLLTFSHEKRLTVEQAICHPYFDNLKRLDNPPRCEKKFDWDWEKQQLHDLQNDQLICKLIYEESLSFHPEGEDECADINQNIRKAINQQQSNSAQLANQLINYEHNQTSQSNQQVQNGQNQSNQAPQAQNQNQSGQANTQGTINQIHQQINQYQNQIAPNTSLAVGDLPSDRHLRTFMTNFQSPNNQNLAAAVVGSSGINQGALVPVAAQTAPIGAAAANQNPLLTSGAVENQKAEQQLGQPNDKQGNTQDKAQKQQSQLGKRANAARDQSVLSGGAVAIGDSTVQKRQAIDPHNDVRSLPKVAMPANKQNNTVPQIITQSQPAQKTNKSIQKVEDNLLQNKVGTESKVQQVPQNTQAQEIGCKEPVPSGSNQQALPNHQINSSQLGPSDIGPAASSLEAPFEPSRTLERVEKLDQIAAKDAAKGTGQGDK